MKPLGLPDDSLWNVCCKTGWYQTDFGLVLPLTCLRSIFTAQGIRLHNHGGFVPVYARGNY